MWIVLPGQGWVCRGMIRGRTSVSQVLRKSFVRNLFGVFKDLRGSCLVCRVPVAFNGVQTRVLVDAPRKASRK